MIPAQKRGRHLYWSNFILPTDLKERKTIGIATAKNEVKKLCEFHDYDFYKYKGKQPINKMARNLVDYEAGRTIFETALGIYKNKNTNQKILDITIKEFYIVSISLMLLFITCFLPNLLF